jgi:hypothetical protein
MTGRFAPKAVRRYLRSGRVQGWLHPFSAEVIAAVSEHQRRTGIHGAVAEIGVHHGKLFLVLFLTSAVDEKALAIDVFGKQHLNLDGSGKGDRATFFANVTRYAGSQEGLVVFEESSLAIEPDAILGSVGQVRLFSIDGAHTEEATTNDLALAESVISEEGILIIDDCLNEAWPEVSAAVAKYLYGPHALSPFAITPGKVFFCKPHRTGFYAGFLRAAFPNRVDKRARLYGHEVTLLGVFPWTLRRRFGRTRAGMTINRLLGRI